MKVAVFGSASTQPGEYTYQESQRLGSMLGSLGHTVLTGGYGGVMEAASRGCSESGGHAIGVTCTQIEDLRSAKANQWVEEEIHLESLRERMYTLIDSCDAAIAMPGGVGTICELMVMWNEMILDSKTPRPLILVGSEWNAVLSQFIDSLGAHIRMNTRDLVMVAPDVDSAIKFLFPIQHSTY